MTQLAAEHVSAGYGRSAVLHDIGLAVRGGELVALVGPNGAGKSTLLRILAGLLRPTAGRVTLDGDDLVSVARASVARRVAVVPQVFETLFPFTVREIVSLGRTPWLGALGIPDAADLHAVSRALADVDAVALADRRIDRISGGERQRAVLAMALAQQAEVLLLDEPTVHLDPAHQRAILALLARLARERQLVVVTVLHDLNLASAVATRIAVLRDGRVVFDGPPRDALAPTLVREVFGEGLDVVMHHGRPFVVPDGARVEVRAD